MKRWRAALSVAAMMAADCAMAVESHPGLDTAYETLTARDGAMLTTIVTKPEGAEARLPAILYLQPLSCDTVELPESGGDGWAEMLRGVIRRSGALVWRTEKRGIGGSQGDCAALDYETELSDHRDALAALLQRPDVDPRRVVIYGASMGGTYAPLLAADADVAGVIDWGAGAAPWLERTQAFERSALALSEADPASIGAEMTARYRFLLRYLVNGETPAAIAAHDAELGQTWQRIVGTDGVPHYGRPLAFHIQAQAQNWLGAWARVKAPVLVMYGEYDWFEQPGSLEQIADVVNADQPDQAQFVLLPRTDHHFSRYPSRRAAFAGKGGTVDAEPALKAILGWLENLPGWR